ncbi:MAG TPA: aspartate-semialdehyde dehydrogenase [Clostridia bacterium]|nr:aspartate-semialdehyde dehydrogenase [Clostridia bacterium]
MAQYTLAVIGATGMVGRKILQVLEERRLPVKQYYFFASHRSAGTKLRFLGEEHVVLELNETCFKGLNIDIALFSAGATVSGKFAPLAVEAGAAVIDNSSFWRMDKDIPLVVPEVNPEHLAKYKTKGIIANPNCSTIQAVVVLKPIADKYGLKRVIYSTYQSVSGAGRSGVLDLDEGLRGNPPTKFVYPIAGNCIPHIDSFLDNGYTKEEQKLIDETRKILSLPELPITATAVRVPVYFSHSESINLELGSAFNLDELKELLKRAPGLVVIDDIKANKYPMPIDAEGTDIVYLGRIRRDFSIENGVNLWCVADNVRKGAATNAVQIAEELIRQWQA